jgi:hypothetical protein
VRPTELKRVLQQVRRGTLSTARAARAIAEAPFERLEFATLDHQRALRVGFPEVVFGLRKTPQQLVAIVTRLARRNPVVLATRVDDAGRAALAHAFPTAEIHDRARAVVVRRPTDREARASRSSRGPVATRRERRSALAPLLRCPPSLPRGRTRRHLRSLLLDSKRQPPHATPEPRL